MNLIKVDSKGCTIEVDYGDRKAGEYEPFECHTALIDFLAADAKGLAGNAITGNNLDYSKLFGGRQVKISAVYTLPYYLLKGDWITGWTIEKQFQ